MPSLGERVAALEAQVSALLEHPPSNGKRSAECRQGLDPLTCFKASPYNYQQGCGGAACAEARRKYYGKKPIIVEPPKRKKRL